jgi:hypothetical protein
VSALIARYLASLERELGYDRALARRVRCEAEDHLSEAIAADSGCDAERRAIERFGEPSEIAARFACSSLRRQRKVLATTFLAAVVLVFLAMKVRLAAVGPANGAFAHDPRLAAAAAAVLAIDRCTFWFAIVAGAGAWVHAIRAPMPAVLDAAFRRWLRVSFILSSLATAGVLASIAADAFLASARLAVGAAQRSPLVLLATLGIEVGLGTILVAAIRKTMRRAETTSVLLASRTERGQS